VTARRFLRVEHVAALWAFVFAALHFAWAAGWYIGLDPVAARQMFAVTWKLIYDLVVGGLCVVGGAVALALAHPWGRRFPRWLVGGLGWAGTSLLVIRGGGGMLQAFYWAVTGRDVVQWSLLWELWFCGGAFLFWLSVHRFWRATAVPFAAKGASHG
jgi:hypothetical protein